MSKHITESECKDFILETATNAQRAQLMRHTADCLACRAILQEQDAQWQQIHRQLQADLWQKRPSSQMNFKAIASDLPKLRRFSMFQQTSTRIMGGVFAIAALVIAFLLLNNFQQLQVDQQQVDQQQAEQPPVVADFADIGAVTPEAIRQPQIILSDGRSSAGWHTKNVNFQAESATMRVSSDYETGIDTTVSYQGNHSGYIKSTVDDTDGYGYLYQTIQADAYRGQRIRITAALKIEDVDGFTGIATSIYDSDGVTVDGVGSRDSSFNGTQDWQLKEAFIDVPDNSAYIAFNLYLQGTGQVWADDWQIEIVTSDTDSASDEDAGVPQNLNMEESTANGEPQGWILSGSNPEDFQVSLDNSIFTEGNSSALLQFDSPSVTGFDNLMQAILPDAYRGQRVRFSGDIKTEGTSRVSPWMRVDGSNSQVLQFDNSYGRALVGTHDWTPFEIVLDVPEESVSIVFGVMASGRGMAWIDNVQFEIVGEDVPSTNDIAGVSSINDASSIPYSIPLRKKLYGIDKQTHIGTPLQGWFEAGSQPEAYTMDVDGDVLSPEGGMPSVYIRGNTAEALGTGELVQAISAENYQGQRVRLTVYLRGDGITGQAMPFLSVDSYGGRALAKAGAGSVTLSGYQEWTPYELVLDVPDAASYITLGVALKGAGTVWIGDVQLETVGDDVPTTNLFDVEAPINLGFEE